jgi:geranylgeranyl diphosphate synthase type I
LPTVKYVQPSFATTAVDFSELASYRPRLERAIARDYAEARADARPVFRPYLDAIREFTLRGGKRFRALLVLAGYHLVRGEPPDAALPAAAALEHFQSWMLVHDDIIDHSEERRGGPTVHRALADRHRALGRLGSADAFGSGMGITLGDLLEPFTVASLLQVPVAERRRLAALGEYVAMTRETAFGQLLDIENAVRPIAEVQESDVLLVHELKSAVYTVASPLKIGALLAGARPALVDDLEAYGRAIGVAFQLRDDVLGTGFDAGAAGKSANDLAEGKRTLLVVRAFQSADAASRTTLTAAVGNAAATARQLESARDVIRATGSLAYSETKIRTLADRAFRRVDGSRSFRPAGKALLREVGDRLIHRSV